MSQREQSVRPSETSLEVCQRGDYQITTRASTSARPGSKSAALLVERAPDGGFPCPTSAGAIAAMYMGAIAQAIDDCTRAIQIMNMRNKAPEGQSARQGCVHRGWREQVTLSSSDAMYLKMTFQWQRFGISEIHRAGIDIVAREVSAAGDNPDLAPAHGGDRQRPRDRRG